MLEAIQHYPSRETRAFITVYKSKNSQVCKQSSGAIMNSVVLGGYRGFILPHFTQKSCVESGKKDYQTGKKSLVSYLPLYKQQAEDKGKLLHDDSIVHY